MCFRVLFLTVSVSAALFLGPAAGPVLFVVGGLLGAAAAGTQHAEHTGQRMLATAQQQKAATALPPGGHLHAGGAHQRQPGKSAP